MDYCGVIRCKVIPISLLGKPVRVVQAVMTLTPWGVLGEGVSASVSGELELVPLVKQNGVSWPQWQALGPYRPRLVLPWHPNHEVVIAKMVDSNGEPWVHCPKSALVRAVALLKEKDLNVHAGFELEFALFTVDPIDGKSLRHFGRSASYASHDQFDMAASFVDDVTTCLEQMEISVLLLHAEAGPGHFEIVLGHKNVVDAVHDLIVARLAVKAIARKHGLVASFVPSYAERAAGSGSHVHLSLQDHFETDDELNGIKIGVSKTGQQFMAGILKNLPWLVFLMNSSPLSYARLRPHCWVGAYQVWGDNNKEAPLRLAEDRSNFEIKLLDGTSNADLALAGVLLAGLKGIEENAELPEPCQVDPGLIDKDKRPALLPNSLQASLEEFEKAYKGGRMKEVIMNEMAEDLMKVKSSEIEYVRKNGLAAYRELLLTLH